MSAKSGIFPTSRTFEKVAAETCFASGQTFSVVSFSSQKLASRCLRRVILQPEASVALLHKQRFQTRVLDGDPRPTRGTIRTIIEDSPNPHPPRIIRAMMPAFDRLTEKQREVLRLFYQNYEIKEIARVLNMKDHAVTERLRSARRTLGMTKSMEAARALAEHEGYMRSVGTSDGVPPTASPRDQHPQKRSDDPVAVVANRYNLTPIQRLGIVLAAAIGFVVLSGSIAMGVYALSYLFKVERVSVAEKPYTK